ncbi:methyltransferase domain-containing protein [uncultured Tenacibaculum sp.]|uniref:class I SAM-dependent methyltransferase n=1 Tax=uncultured Tenacibaculum sp. TaxID=174713 RepID=UPI00261127E6|nr:methyltransferase domain-containing protein [uncultured Tenacibaculum sp.]
MEINRKRKRFQGVLNILSFNRHFYIIGVSALIVLWCLQSFFNWPEYIKWVILLFFSYGLLIPLIVSAYVYDYSRYYDFEWLEKLELVDSRNTKILNINAGFDETSFIIKRKLSKSTLKVFDFYEELKHTERAIKIARKVSQVYPNTEVIKTNRIPLKDKSVDTIFLLSAAHEIRSNSEKVTFLKECNRVLKYKGKIILVEHLRDLPNFLAFSVGFTHFFSKNTWKNVFKEAGLSIKNEIKFTPFMSIFNFSKSI